MHPLHLLQIHPLSSRVQALPALLSSLSSRRGTVHMLTEPRAAKCQVTPVAVCSGPRVTALRHLDFSPPLSRDRTGLPWHCVQVASGSPAHVPLESDGSQL